MGARRKSQGEDTHQLSFDGYFALPKRQAPVPGSFAFGLELRNLLAGALKECALSRAEIAGRMTDLMYGDAGDGEVTKAMLDSWTRSADAWRFPLEALPAFVEATGATWLLDAIAERCGCRILVGEQALLAQLGAVMVEEKRLAERKAALKKSVSPDVIARLLKEDRS